MVLNNNIFNIYNYISLKITPYLLISSVQNGTIIQANHSGFISHLLEMSPGLSV